MTQRFSTLEELRNATEVQKIVFFKSHWCVDSFTFEGQYDRSFGGFINIRKPGSEVPLSLPFNRGKLQIKVPSTIGLMNGTYAFEIKHQNNSADSFQVVSKSIISLSVHRKQQPIAKQRVSMSPKLLKEVQLLQEDWKDDTFVITGAYCRVKGTNNFQFEDLRSTTFTPRTYLDDSEIIIPLESPIGNLVENVYYTFKWTLVEDDSEKGYRLALTPGTDFRLVEPRTLVKNLYKVWDKNSADAADQMKDTMKMVSTQLTASSDGTFVYELLQNANDYPVQVNGIDQKVDVEFYIIDEYLIYRHSGDYFSPRNIAAISKIAAGEKARKKNAIGYKGIGFKTIFTDNNYVYLKSGEYSLRFDESARTSRYNPWQIMPIWTEQQEVAYQIRDIFAKEYQKFRVQMAIRPNDVNILRNDAKCYEFIFNDIFEDERDIAFIPNIRSVKVYIDGNLAIDCKKNSEHWLITEKPYKYEFLEEEIEENNEEVARNKRIPEKYKDFTDTYFSFACKKNGNILLPVEDSRIYCYLPTQISLGLPFLMNTDMIPTGPRDDIEKNIQFNHKLIKIAGSKLVEWLKQLLESKNYDWDSVFSLVPSFDPVTNYEDFIKEFSEGFEAELGEGEFIPVLDNGEIAYKKVSCIIYDTCGISNSGIMSDKEILTFADGKEWTSYDTEFFAHPLIRGKANFDTFIKKYHADNTEFGLTILKGMCDNTEFQKWLKQQGNNYKFLNFLLEHGYLMTFIEDEKAIFIGNDGELHVSSDLFYNIDNHLDDLACFADDYLPRLSKDTRDSFADNEDWAKDIVNSFKDFDADAFVNDVLDDDEMLSLLKEKDDSVAFIHFLAKNEVDNDDLLNLSFFNDNGDLIADYNRLVFFESKRGKEVSEYDWIDEDWMNFISSDYVKNDGDLCIAYLKSQFGVKDYTDKEIVDSIIKDSEKTEFINGYLDEVVTALPFMDFVGRNASEFEEGDLKSFHVVAVGKDGDEVAGPADNNTFFASSLYEELDSKTWVSRGWMFSLSEAYFKDKSEDANNNLKALFNKAFGVRKLEKSVFVDAVLLDHIEDLKDNLSDVDSNIDFWRWVKSSSREKAKDMLAFPIVAIDSNDDKGVYTVSDNSIYMSDGMMPDGQYIESIVKKYYDDALFVVSDYVEDKTIATKKEWRKFFEELGVMSEQTELVFDQIIPNLTEIEDPAIPGMLAQAREFFEERNIELSDLTSLRLETRDGEYNEIGDCSFVTCRNTEEPFKGIELSNEFVLSQFNAETRALLTDIAKEVGSSVIENLNDWRAAKINKYLEMQEDDELTKEIHLGVVTEILNMGDNDRKDLYEYIQKIQLLSKADDYYDQSGLTLGTAYHPLCDFETNGITDDYLTYLSEDYLNLECESIGKQIRAAFKVHYRFTESDIDLLSNYTFADFFWRRFIPNKSAPVETIKSMIEDGKFADKKCVPTADGSVDCAENLYSRKELKDYMNLVENWGNSYPCNDFPDETYEILNLLPFKESLSFDDGLNALKGTEDQTKRYNILKWMSEDYDYSRYQNIAISGYRDEDKSKWKNRSKKKCLLKDLYALDINQAANAKYLEQYFKLHPRVILDDYFVKYDTDIFYKECDMLQITVIKWEDMILDPELSTNNDETLKDILRNYLLFVAAIEKPESWSTYYNEICEEFDKLTFKRCKSISLTYSEDEDISQTAKKFYHDTEELIFYYVGRWDDRLVFTDFVDELRSVIGSDLDRDMFMQIFVPKIGLQELESFANEYCTDMADDENFRNIISQQLGVKLATGEYEEDDEEPELAEVERRNEYITSNSSHEYVPDYEDVEMRDNTDEEEESEEEKDDEDIVEGSTNETPFVAPNVGNRTGIIQRHVIDADDESAYVNEVIENEDDDEDDEDAPIIATISNNRERKPRTSTPEERKSRSSYNPNWTPAPNNSTEVRKRRNYSGYSPEKFKARQFYAGSQDPLTLSSREIDHDEVQYLSNLFGRALNVDTIKDENYIVRMRFYNSLKENGLEMDMDEREFVENGTDKIVTKSGKYVHRCSARSGILYISPSVWNRLREERWVVCFYSGKKADQFVYVRSQEELMHIINQDALVIQVTGNDKREIVDKVYEDGFYGMEGNIYTLIRTIKVEGEVTPFDDNVTDYYSEDDDNETNAL